MCNEKRECAEVVSRISYASTVTGDSKTASSHAERIAALSRRLDASSRISGQLFLDEESNRVWHVLEGAFEDVSDLWSKISKDGSHIIDEDTIKVERGVERKYPDGWGLKYLRIGGGAACAHGTKDATGLVQLTYKSVMLDCGGRERQVIDHFVPGAVENNLRRGVTSWMLYNDFNLTIYQVLEGPADCVEEVWKIIQNNPRHIILPGSVKHRVIDRRDFPDWPLAVDTIEPKRWRLQCY